MLSSKKYNTIGSGRSLRSGRYLQYCGIILRSRPPALLERQLESRLSIRGTHTTCIPRLVHHSLLIVLEHIAKNSSPNCSACVNSTAYLEALELTRALISNECKLRRFWHHDRLPVA